MKSRTYRTELRLQTIDDFFRQPDISPLSAAYQVYSSMAGIEFIARELAGQRRPGAIEVTLRLPAAQIGPELEARTHAAVQRYCGSRIKAIETELAQLWDQVRQTLLIAIPAWFVLLSLGGVLAAFKVSVLDIAGQVLGVAAWVLLWFPLDAMIFGMRYKRRERDTYRRLLAMRLRILPAT